MRHAISMAMMFSAALLVCGAVKAQTQPANPLNLVPDKMPFATPYGSRTIGCSGGTGAQDQAICTAAAATINK